MISIRHTDERWPDVEGTPIPMIDDGPGPITCDRCDLPVVTQVTDRFSFGLYCRAHGDQAEAARQNRIRQANNAARRRR